MPGVTPLATVRRMELTAPPGVPADDVLLSIAAELDRRGHDIRYCGGGTLAWDNPAPWGRKLSHRALKTVVGGSVTLDAPGPVPRVRVELRYSVNFTYLFPALVTLIAALADFNAIERLLMIAGVAALTWFHCWTARSAYEGWIAEGALRAARYAGATRANARAGTQGGKSPLKLPSP